MYVYECKLCMHADSRVCINPDRELFFNIFKHILIKTLPNHVSTLSKVLGFHLNSSHSITQAFTYPKTNYNGGSKPNLKMRKVWKTHQSGPCICREMILWPIGQWRRFIQLYSPIPTCEIEGITREHIRGFLGLGFRCHGKDERVWERKRVLDERFLEGKIRLWGNEREAESFCREREKLKIRENVKRWGRWREIRRKRKEMVGNHWTNLKKWECVWCLNYM